MALTALVLGVLGWIGAAAENVINEQSPQMAGNVIEITYRYAQLPLRNHPNLQETSLMIQ